MPETTARPKPDFAGFATKYGIRCSDGRTILPDAFKHLDGKKVSLLYQHDVANIHSVVGHTILEHRDGVGVYAYGYINQKTTNGPQAFALVEHGDIDCLSISANQLRQNGMEVVHGNIREVSLVVSGANPGARIENAVYVEDGVRHIDDEVATIFSGGAPDPESLVHQEPEPDPAPEPDPKPEEPEPTDSPPENGEAQHADNYDDVQELFNKMSGQQRAVIYSMLSSADQASNVKRQFNELDEDQQQAFYAMMTAAMSHGDDVEHADGETVGEVWDTLTDKQKIAVAAMLAAWFEEANTTEHSDNNQTEGDNTMANPFENTKGTQETTGNKIVLTHSEMTEILNKAKGSSLESGFSLRKTFTAHLAEFQHDSGPDHYGIENIEVLFPDARLVRNTPDTVSRDTGWVAPFLAATNKTPFARLRSTAANLKEDEARAKGYIKANQKKEQVFPAMKRETHPQTVYKKQKLDRDDTIDITDFDVVAWINGTKANPLTKTSNCPSNILSSWMTTC